MLLGLAGAYKADASAAEIIKRCTGEATLAAIIDDLASRQTMARSKIALDVLSWSTGSSARCCWSWFRARYP